MIKTFSLVVWNMQTGDFKNKTITALNSDLAKETFEITYEDFKVIHVFEGKQPEKTYRSLPYLD